VPSDTLCEPMWNIYMHSAVAASTKGIEITTTMPVRKPRLSRLTSSTMPTASATASTKSSTECADRLRHAGDLGQFQPRRQRCAQPRGQRIELPCPARSHRRRAAMVTPIPSTVAAIEAHGLRCRRIGVAAPDGGDVAQAEAAGRSPGSACRRACRTVEIWPVGRTNPVVGGVEHARPATEFCAFIASAICCGVMPSFDSWHWPSRCRRAVLIADEVDLVDAGTRSSSARS
jgi:hypothetical protein